MAKIKDKERVLKAARGKQLVTHKGTPIRLSADFSAETLQARREWHDILKVMRGGSSLAVQWLGLHAPAAESLGSIPGRGTKIPQATRRSQKKEKNY